MESNLYYFFALGVINGATFSWACRISSDRSLEVAGRLFGGVVIFGLVVTVGSLALALPLLAFGVERWWDNYLVAPGGPMDQWRVITILTLGMAVGVIPSVMLMEKAAAIRARRKLALTEKRD